MLNPKLFWACPFEKEMEEVSLEHDSPSLDVICLLTSGYGPWVLAPLIINGHSITLVGYMIPDIMGSTSPALITNQGLATTAHVIITIMISQDKS